jgi:hypothetical protein
MVNSKIAWDWTNWSTQLTKTKGQDCWTLRLTKSKKYPVKNRAEPWAADQRKGNRDQTMQQEDPRASKIGGRKSRSLGHSARRNMIHEQFWGNGTWPMAATGPSWGRKIAKGKWKPNSKEQTFSDLAQSRSGKQIAQQNATKDFFHCNSMHKNNGYMEVTALPPSIDWK